MAELDNKRTKQVLLASLKSQLHASEEIGNLVIQLSRGEVAVFIAALEDRDRLLAVEEAARELSAAMAVDEQFPAKEFGIELYKLRAALERRDA